MNNPLTSIVLLVLGLGLFFTFTQGKYQDVLALSKRNDQYIDALQNMKKIISTRDNLLNRYNAFTKEDIDRLAKILPSSIDNVKLIVDINGILSKYNVKMKEIQLDGTKEPAAAAAAADPTAAPYRTANLSFALTTNYDTMISILNDMESTLRLMDVVSVDVSASKNEAYDYKVKLKTYWMK